MTHTDKSFGLRLCWKMLKDTKASGVSGWVERMVKISRKFTYLGIKNSWQSVFYQANKVRGSGVAVGPTATVVVFFFHRLGHFELSSPSPSEISYAANAPYCKEPFLVASAKVLHQSGFFSTQPWTFKNSGESEKSYPHLTWHFFSLKTQANVKCTCRKEVLHVYS